MISMHRIILPHGGRKQGTTRAAKVVGQKQPIGLRSQGDTVLQTRHQQIHMRPAHFADPRGINGDIHQESIHSTVTPRCLPGTVCVE